MIAPRLNLVIGGGTPTLETDDATVPRPDGAIIHLHLHFGEPAQATKEKIKKSSSARSGVIAGVAVVASFVGGYGIGNRPTQDDGYNLRPTAALRMPMPPEPAWPALGQEVGLAALQRQLATPPQIIMPARASQPPATSPMPIAPAPAATAPVPVAPTRAATSPIAAAPNPAAPGPSGSGRNAFGLEN